MFIITNEILLKLGMNLLSVYLENIININYFYSFVLILIKIKKNKTSNNPRKQVYNLTKLNSSTYDIEIGESFQAPRLIKNLRKKLKKKYE